MAGIRDPFARPDGSRAGTPEEFYENRAYLKELMQRYVYGYMPALPRKSEVSEVYREDILGGAAVNEYRTISFDGLSMKVRIAYPRGAKKLPAIMRLDYLCGREYAPSVENEMLKAGRYVFVTVSRRDLCEDEPSSREGLPYAAEGLGAVGIWGLGACVCLDHISGMEAVDASKVALTGHSRDGKAAIFAAAMDERFAAVIPNGSGCGGAGSFFVRGPGSESLEIIVKNLGAWFSERLLDFAGEEKLRKLPVDMIFSLALIAPRPILCTEAENDLWANPRGTFTNVTAVNRICEFLGAGKNVCGMVVRPGNHDQTDADWRALVEFTDRVFYGKAPETDLNRKYFDVTAGDIPWEIPKKQDG